MKLHRHMYILKYGFIPEGQVIRHKCNNRICVNPDHLIPGSVSDNVHDAIESKTHISVKNKTVLVGIRPPRPVSKCKLTKQQVIEIRTKYIPKVYSAYKLAKEYGIGRSTVQDIVSRKIWADT